ncbi:MAG: HIT domain-containing protein [bacterium]
MKKNRGQVEILWAPWRIEYIENAEKNEGCVFCSLSSQSDDRKNLIVHRGAWGFVIMNRYPYNNGHLMVVPFQHTPEMASLSDDEKIELFDFLRVSQEVLREVMKPQGFNIGMNVGRLAGAGIVDHLHFHVVPRWGGDTNFMPIIGHTKIISEGLEQTWEKLKKGFDKQQSSTEPK